MLILLPATVGPWRAVTIDELVVIQIGEVGTHITSIAVKDRSEYARTTLFPTPDWKTSRDDCWFVARIVPHAMQTSSN